MEMILTTLKALLQFALITTLIIFRLPENNVVQADNIEATTRCFSGSQPHRNEEDNTIINCGSTADCPTMFECESQTKYCCPTTSYNEKHNAYIKNVTRLESENDHERYCGTEGHLYKEKDNILVKCQKDSDCLPPSQCYNHGFCCLLPLAQEPPPIGCPKSTRPLKNIKGEELKCSPNQPGSCPGRTMCYEDSFDGSYRCCGKDPSEGCASGTRALKHANGTTRLCMPGTPSEICPGMAICQWSFAIDRYQCCEPDNGCPIGQIPLESRGEVISCSLNKGDRDSECPDGSSCIFNFWTASYQCCKPSETELCPAGEVPYLSNESPNPFTCRSDNDCPNDYSCFEKSHTCCGEAGQCPNSNQRPFRDHLGNLRACSMSDPNTCPTGSECIESITDNHERHHILIPKADRQHLCCSMSATFYCQISGEPFPNANNPQQCNIDNPMACPIDMLCQNSNIPEISICCTSPTIGTRNLCPKGWQSYNDLTVFCHPTVHNSCPGYSSCILSPLTQQFLCCEPESYQHPPTTRHMVHKSGSYSMESLDNFKNSRPPPRYPSTSRKNSHSHTQYSALCPSTYEKVEFKNGRIRSCSARQASASLRGRCGTGYVCRRSTVSASDNIENSMERKSQRHICCSKRQAKSPSKLSPSGLLLDDATFRCPNHGQMPYLINNRNVFCNIGQRNDCPSGTSCQSAINSANMYICCYNTYTTTLICPASKIPQASSIGFVPCDLLQPNQCRQGYICVPAMNEPSLSLCCSRTTINQLICPNQQSFYLESGRPRYCTLNQQAPCPAGFSCQESLGQPGIFICCSVPSYTVCPTGYTPSLDYYSSGIINCSPSDINVCPSDAQCLQAQNRAGAYLCCRSTTPPRVCPNNQHALLRPNSNQPETCTSPSASCSSPVFSCQFSPVMNTYVCCGRPQLPILCADGRETYVQEAGKTFTCNPMTFPRECPNGYECSHSNIGSTHVCCRITFDPFAPTQTPTDLLPRYPGPAAPPQPPVTFRPPVDEITCPTGWSAYEDNKGAHHFCLDALDMSCPQGFSCAQSSITGIFMCCRLASNIQCPKSYSTLLINNSPRLCSINRPPGLAIATYRHQPPAVVNNGCPLGYTCLQSTVPAIYVCCSAAPRGDLICSDGQIPAYLGQFVRSCAVLGQIDQCPPSYVCSPSDRPGYNVCCHTYPNRPLPVSITSAKRIYRQQDSENVCGDLAIPLLTKQNNKPIPCSSDASCPPDFNCLESSDDPSDRYCCQIARCPNFGFSNASKAITESKFLQKCSSDNECLSVSESENLGIFDRKCLPAENMENVKICCDSTVDISAISPSNAKVYSLRLSRCLKSVTLIAGAGAYLCDPENAEKSCPPGYICSTQTTMENPICCAQVTDEPIKSVHEFAINDKTTNETSEKDKICSDNREPYQTNGTYAFCDGNAEGCPIGFLCKPGIGFASGRRICCTPIAFCGRGKLPLIDPAMNNQAKRCSKITATESAECASGYSCQESTVENLNVCCSDYPQMSYTLNQPQPTSMIVQPSLTAQMTTNQATRQQQWTKNRRRK